MGSDDLFKKRKARSNAVLQRERREREQNKRYLIVCEGTKTEPQYFHDLLKYIGIRLPTVHIAKNQGVSPDRVVAHALDLYEEDAKKGDAYDAVYCVFDRDKHTTFEAAVQQTRDCQAAGKPLIAITSAPCFEVWLLLHFGYTDQPFHAAGRKSVGDQVVAQLKKKPGLSKYSKGQQGIHALLKEKLGDALKNAERLRQHSKDTGSTNPATDVDKLVLVLQQLGR